MQMPENERSPKDRKTKERKKEKKKDRQADRQQTAAELGFRFNLA